MGSWKWDEADEKPWDMTWAMNHEVCPKLICDLYARTCNDDGTRERLRHEKNNKKSSGRSIW